MLFRKMRAQLVRFEGRTERGSGSAERLAMERMEPASPQSLPDEWKRTQLQDWAKMLAPLLEQKWAALSGLQLDCTTRNGQSRQGPELYRP